MKKIPSKLKIGPRELFAGGIVIAVVVFYILIRIYFPQEYIHSFIVSLGPWAPLLYILLSLFVNIFLPTLAPPFVYIGYDIFGKNVVWYIGISAFLNFFTNFWIARLFGRELIERILGKRILHRIDKLSHKYGLATLLFMRIFQGGIHDLISYSAGLTNIKFSQYLLVSVIGLIPGLLIWYATALAFPDTMTFFIVSSLISIVLTGIFLAGSIAVSQLLKHPDKSPSNP